MPSWSMHARRTRGRCRSTWWRSFAAISRAGIFREGSPSQTKYVTRSSPPRVTVTRRHHPFEGKTFELVMGGPKMFVIRLDDESSMRIPRSWTDADGAGAVMDAPAHVFTADALRELGALVASMARRSSPERAMASSRADRATDATSDGDR